MKKQEGLFSQALWLGISQASSFALAFISAAILSRYFDKTEYGTYKQILYVYTTLQTVITIGLPSVFSYFIPRLSDGQGKTLVNKLTNLFFILGLIFSVFLYLGSDVIANLLNNPELSKGLKVFSPFPLLTIPTMGVEGIYTALKKTKYIAIYQTISKSSMLLFIVCPVLMWNGGYIDAIIGWGIASFITFIVAMYMKRKPYVEVHEEIIPGMYKAVFNYSLPLMGASLVGMILHSASQFFISRYYSTEIFAEFSNGYIPLPFVAMIAGSVKAVLLPVFSKADAQNELSQVIPVFENSVKKSINLLFPLLIFFFIFATDIVTILYGKEYAVSSQYLKVILVQNVIEILPFLPIILAFGRSKFYFLVHLIAAIAIWVIDFLVIRLQLPPIAISIVASSIQIGINLIFCFYLINYANIKLLSKDIIYYIFKTIIHLVTIGVLVEILIEDFIDFEYVLSKLIVGGITYYILLITTGKIIHIDYYSFLLEKFKK